MIAITGCRVCKMLQVLAFQIMTTPEGHATGRKTQPRERNINLKKYYGLTASQEKPRPLDIDGKTFNSGKYFTKIMKEKTLNGLMEEDNVLTGEIREIDGDMKTLVYENYSKFISATDTIRKMKSNVENMESEMDRLNESMNSLTHQTTTINQALGPNRDKIQQLSRAHNQLKRLQFIFNLPSRLSRCLSTDQLAKAVKYYARAAQLLDHYKHMPAFKGIERDCQTIITKVKSQIESKMRKEDSVEKIAENIRLLILLKEDVPELRQKYLKLQLFVIEKKQAGPVTSAEELVDVYIVPLDTVVQYYNTLFVENSEDFPPKTKQEIKDANQDLSEAIQTCINSFFESVTKIIALPDNVIEEKRPLKQTRDLQILNEALAEKGTNLSMAVALDKQMSQVIEVWENELVNRFLCTVVSGMRDRMSELIEPPFTEDTPYDALSETLAQFIDISETWCREHVYNNCLIPLRECLQEDIEQSSFTERISNGLNSMWHSLAEHLGTFPNGGEVSQLNRHIVCLVSSRLCFDFADHIIARIYSEFSSKSANPLSRHESIDTIFLSDCQELTELFSQTGQTLLNNQIMEDGYALSAKVQTHYLSLQSKPPTKPSAVWREVFTRLQSVEQLVNITFPQPSSPEGRDVSDSEHDYRFGSLASTLEAPPIQATHSSQSLATMSSGTGEPLGNVSKFGNDVTLNMMHTINKLFEDRVDVYRPIEPSAEGACGALVRVLLKTLQEVVREMWVDCNIYQQLQVDVEYLGIALRSYAGDEKTSSALRDIVSGAYMRCSDPVSINADDLERMLAH
ncbi:exocyst complex component Sec5-domain-containing protein [Phycomyces blakesleeanus]|uniref:Vacuolar protein sorting-associated protein 51 homolog n=1 Tax=Phycomyces blakesleeanus TaxID=4837 RepID=A0ABR3B1J1_PHYBL